MKNSLKLTVLFLLISSMLFGAVPSKGTGKKPVSKDMVTFHSLPANVGVDVIVRKHTPGKVMVILYDDNSNMIIKEVVPAKKVMEKRYVLSKLDNGKYTLEVTVNKHSTTKNIMVDNGQSRFL
jgi:hypothetical protein